MVATHSPTHPATNIPPSLPPYLPTPAYLPTYPATNLTVRAFRKLMSIYVFSYFPFGFEGRMWDLIVSAPDHCLSFYYLYTYLSTYLPSNLPTNIQTYLSTFPVTYLPTLVLPTYQYIHTFIRIVPIVPHPTFSGSH